MKICIPTADSRGMDATAHGHFGSAPFFTVVDTESGSVEVLDNSGKGHQHGQCRPIDHIDPKAVDAVVCQGMGKRALAALTHGGLDVLIATGETVRDIVEEARNGKLRPLTIDEACGGHGHQHGCS